MKTLTYFASILSIEVVLVVTTFVYPEARRDPGIIDDYYGVKVSSFHNNLCY